MKHLRILISAVACVLVAPMAGAQQRELIVMSSKVHETNLRGIGVPNGVDTLIPFEKESGAKVTFNILPSPALQAALPRMGTLSQSQEDLIYISQGTVSPRISAFLEPLDDYLAKKPIANFPSLWAKAAIDAGSVGGKRYLVPMRCGTFILWQNEQYLKDAKVALPIKTPEDLYEAAKKATFKKPSGEQVYGFSMRATVYDLVQTVAMTTRMYGGDFVDSKGKVVLNSPEVIKGVELLRKMYVEGILPPNWTAADTDQLFRDGRLSISVSVDNFQLTGAKPEVVAAAQPAYLPLDKAHWTSERDFAGGVMFYWNVGILKGSTDKQLAYDFLHFVSQPKVQAQMADNGNGPCTADVSAKRGETDKAAQIGGRSLPFSAPPLPGHAALAEATDIIGTAIQEIVVNGAPVKETLDGVAAKVSKLYEG